MNFTGLNEEIYQRELKRLRSEFEANKKNPTQLMDEMEGVFRIPALNDTKYNAANKEVLALYIEIASSRKFA